MGRYRDMAWDDLLAEAGARTHNVDHVLRVMDALSTLGIDKGFENALREALAALAHLRGQLHVQVGDRVRVRPELVSAEAGRWKQQDHASTVKTFSEWGVCEAVNFNEWHDVWYAQVRFDREYWQHYRTKEWAEVEKRHTWAISLDAVECVGAGTYGGKHEKAVTEHLSA